jgi:1-acyl-sn-glycerol-3-phosphate acyltransferase
MIVNDFDLRPARDLGLAPLERLRSVRRESGPFLVACHVAWGLATRAYFWTWHGLIVEGREHLPVEPPFVLCANHASHLDALALAAPLPLSIRDRVFSLAAGDVFFESAVPTAFAAGFVNALPMWRKRRAPRALQELREKLVETPCGFILFPEGARSRDGGYLPFKPGIGMLVAGTDVPVIPCHLTGAFAALPPGCKRPRRERIVIRVGEPVRFAGVPNDKAGWEHVAACVEQRVKGLDRSTT